MIRRELLKMAIDAIASVDRESGYGLGALFDAARIAVPAASPRTDEADGRDVHYYFEGQRVDIPITAMVADGIAALEQSLMVKWGEFRAKQVYGSDWASGDIRQLARRIHEAGAAAAVDFELRRLASPPFGMDAPTAMPDDDACGPHFRGHLAGGQPARFMRLPLNRETLRQIAGHRFEFFTVRYVLECWLDQSLPWIYACIAAGQILGLAQLKLHGHGIAAGLEIKYISRLRPQYEDTQAAIRGIGTFMLAGCWMLWHAFYPRIRRFFLDAEVGARQFYLNSGFRQQRLCRYVLKAPGGYLPAAIADMADDRRPPAPRVRDRLEALIEASIRDLRRSKNGRLRRRRLAFVNRCLLARHQPYPAKSALCLLLKYQDSIPEAAALIDLATRTGRVRIAGESPDSRSTILVVDDARFALHLDGIFHLESPKRFQAFQKALMHPSIAGRWHSLAIEPARRDQLRWVHTDAYLDRLEHTAGKQLVTLDMDTQTTERSWEVACLATGGVFRLVDGICDGRGRRGVAGVRPPGHHAEPDRAMGFCLLNHVALAARYLQRVHAMERIMIIDLDAHHGNGTQTIFYADDSVLFVSAHRFPAYPGTGNFGEIGSGPGRGFTVNIPLPKGAGDRDYVQMTRRIIAPLAHGFMPDFILVSLGFDLYRHDRLGGMQVTAKGYGTLTAMLIRLAEHICRGRIVFVLEGGYSVMGIEKCGLAFLQQLCSQELDEPEPHELRHGVFRPASETVSRVIAVHRPFWPCLA